MGRKKNTPSERHFMLAQVARSERLSEHFVRVTLAGQDVLALPTSTNELGWYLQYLATPKSRRPWVRAYTVREARPEVGEVDIDFVIHADADGNVGPAARFALDAQPGDTVGFLDQGVGFTPAPPDWTLLIGDETALPAIAGICRDLKSDAVGIAFVEIPSADDRQEFPTPAGLEVRWIHRDEHPEAGARPGELALAALQAATLPDGAVHAHCIGESGLATGARRHLVQECGVPKRNVDFVGYWKHGRAATS